VAFPAMRPGLVTLDNTCGQMSCLVGVKTDDESRRVPACLAVESGTGSGQQWVARFMGSFCMSTPELSVVVEQSSSRWLAAGWLASWESLSLSPSQPGIATSTGRRLHVYGGIIPVRRVCRPILFSFALLLTFSCVHTPALLTKIRKRATRKPPTARGDLTSPNNRIPVVAHPPEPAAIRLGNIVRNSLRLLLVHTDTAFLCTTFTRPCCQRPTILEEKPQ
jgi:hypothetical protein